MYFSEEYDDDDFDDAASSTEVGWKRLTGKYDKFDEGEICVILIEMSCSNHLKNKGFYNQQMSEYYKVQVTNAN